MANGRASTVLHYIRRLVAAPHAGARSDGALLEQFIRRRDEEAFATMVQRYGGLVLSVCRRVLGHEQDAEDAFQATFLVLARKAASISNRDSVSSWLYGVALRIARKARAGNMRRQIQEVVLSQEASFDPAPEWIWRELQPVIDQEIDRLPEHYRQAFILCHLQGKSNAEAALELGCRPGTIFSRLARARGLLRERLSRRGLALSTAVLTTVLADNLGQAAVPAGLQHATVSGVIDFLAGATATAGPISSQALALAQGAMRRMFLSKLRILIAAVVMGGLGLASVGLWTYQVAARDKPVQAQEAAEPAPKDTGGLTTVIKVPSRKDGVVLVIGTEIAKGKKPPAEQIVSANVGGQARQFQRLKKGDRVEEGQLLALMDDPLAASEVAIKTAKLSAARVDQLASEKTRDEAKKRYETNTRLSQNKAAQISLEDLRSSELTWMRYIYETQSKGEAIKVAEQELAQAQMLLKMSEIRSPCRGIVKKICVHRGEGVHALEPVVLIQIPEAEE